MYGNDSLEIAAIDTGGGLKIWRSDGSTVRQLGIGYTTRADIAVGDVTGDSKLEVVAAGNDTLVTVIPVSGAPIRIKVGTGFLPRRCSPTWTETARRRSLSVRWT